MSKFSVGDIVTGKENTPHDFNFNKGQFEVMAVGEDIIRIKSIKVADNAKFYVGDWFTVLSKHFQLTENNM